MYVAVKSYSLTYLVITISQITALSHFHVTKTGHDFIFVYVTCVLCYGVTLFKYVRSD